MRTLAKRVVHIGSTSGTLAAEIRVCSLSAFQKVSFISVLHVLHDHSFQRGFMHTVISTPSSARIKAAYEVASSAFDIVNSSHVVSVQADALLSRVSGSSY